MTKTLPEMTQEVADFCQAKGWNDQVVTFGEAMALLASEVSEALEAYRKWGTDDATSNIIDAGAGESIPKPEGVGSEFADILIRLLDDCGRFGVDLEDKLGIVGAPAVVLFDSFGENMMLLHSLIVNAWAEHELPDPMWRQIFADIYSITWQLSEKYGIDLEFEYERKMNYNRSRAYRHGGKRL